MSHLGARVSALVDGQLGPSERDRALVHVAHCDTCQAAVDAERSVKALLAGSARPTPSDGLLASLHGLAEPGGPVSPRPRSMPLGPVVPTLPAPGRGPFGSRRDSRRPARGRRAQRVRYAAAGAVSVAGLVLGTAFAAGGSRGRRSACRATRGRALGRARRDHLGTPAGRPGLHRRDRLIRRAQRRRDLATVKRITVSTGPIAVLGPLALLSLFLLSDPSGAAGIVVPVSATSSDAAAMRLLHRASARPLRRSPTAVCSSCPRGPRKAPPGWSSTSCTGRAPAPR